MSDKMSDSENKVIDVEAKLRDITECAICTDTFQEPKILSCVHTFCKKCLQEFATKLTKGPGDQIPCPICRKKFEIPKEGFDGLTRNFFMERLIEIQSILKPSSSTTELCEACPDDIKSDAEVYCADCQLRLCGNCHRYHIKSKVTKNHRIITLDTTSEVQISTVEKMMSVFCTIHDMKPLEIYCSNCSDTVCAICFIESHKSHNGSPVSSVVGDIEKQIRHNIDSLEDYITPLEKRRVDLEDEKLEVIQNTADLEVELTRARDEMRALIDEHHISIVHELNTRRCETLKEMDMEKDDVETLLASLQSYKAYCEQVTTLGSASNICRNINGLNARAEELKNLCETRVVGIYRRYMIGLLKKQDPLEVLRSAGENLFGRIKEGFFGNKFEAQNPIGNVGEDNSAEDTARKTPAEKFKEYECNVVADITEGSVCTIEVSEMRDKSKENAANKFGTELEFERQRCRELETTNLSLTTINDEFRNEKEQHNRKVEELENQNSLLRAIIGRDSAKKQKVRGNIIYEDGLKYLGEIFSVSRSNGKFHLISGIAVNGLDVFVVSEATKKSSIVEVFDVLTLQFVRRWIPNKVGQVKDLIHCSSNHCLYFLTQKDAEQFYEIIRLDLYGLEINRWPAGESTGQLSITPESNILLTAWSTCQLEEYSPDGRRLNVIKLSWNFGFANVWHAVKLNTKHYVISHGEPTDRLRRLCIVDNGGNLLCNTRESLGRPIYLQIDSYQNVLCVDNKIGWNTNPFAMFNFNLTLVNSALYTYKETAYSTRVPEKAVLDESSGRFFVIEQEVVYNLRSENYERNNSFTLSVFVFSKK